jgi:GGDEF domain-containing protein
MTLTENLEMFAELEKMDSSLGEALRAFRAAGLHQHADLVAKHLFHDSLVPKMGNALAYKDFLSRHQNDGVHTHVDLNDFGQINKLHGEKLGDDAIQLFGKAASEVSRQFAGKSFRNHGDEFKFWFARPEQAHGFARELRTRLEKIPKVGGTHNIAAAIGIGFTPDNAEKALITAKGQLGPMGQDGKRQNTHAAGNAPTVMHSLTHESPPNGWTPGVGAPSSSKNPVHVPDGLTLHNPLAGK